MDAIKDYLNSRLKHPFLGTLTLSLLFANWKIILISTTGNLNPAERIDQILKLELSFWSNLTLPILIALLFVILYPILNTISILFFHLIKIKEESWKTTITENYDMTTSRQLSKTRSILKVHVDEHNALNNSLEVQLTQLYPTTASNQLRADLKSSRELNNKLSALSSNDSSYINSTYRNLPK